MNNVLITGEFYDQKSFFSLGGAATAVWIFTNVIGNVFELDLVNNYKWLGLFLSIFIAFLGSYKIKKIDVVSGTLTIFNGFLIFVAASGINAINHGVTGNSNINEQSATLLKFLDKEIWWKPTEMTQEIIMLQAQKDSIINQNNVKIKYLLDSCSRNYKNVNQSINKDSIDFNASKIKSLEKEVAELRKSKRELDSYNNQKEIPEVAKVDTSEFLSNAREDLINQIINFQNSKIELEKNVNMYLDAGTLNPGSQIQALREMNIKILSLKSGLDKSDKEIQRILDKLNY
ncbi:hypothetical protein [Cyclobacterium plantarum]|uniref:Gliding motility-associated protein GldL n=1 Tax=Cyclobacterium plantarum TaxID=2716263 RepID=A0ABX0H6S2_9BACT|nr:hypothetical protein [Cyclobacterium plantarum]NHE57570.1 hypothetical protein [Cyclobacterium plantarum]